MARKTQKPTGKARKKPAPAEGFLHRAVASGGDIIARNPTLVGGTTAFLIALFFVAANAMWYQPHFHKGAFFPTREMPNSALPSEEEVEPQAAEHAGTTAPEPADPVVHQVQTVLQDLKLYRGPLDGNLNKATADAIATYQKILGQPTTGEVDDALLSQLGISTSTASIKPATRDAAADIIRASAPSSPAAQSAGGSGLSEEERLKRIQAGLRAFGNDNVDVDGLMGAKTRSAIREFQQLFGMNVTGEPDEALYARMREIGLTK